MDDTRGRIASLTRQNVKIGFDLSEMRATPVTVDGLPYCGTPGHQPEWVQLNGDMIFTYDSTTVSAREPVHWPETSHILIPTVIEEGVRKFDGYCPELSMGPPASP